MKARCRLCLPAAAWKGYWHTAASFDCSVKYMGRAAGLAAGLVFRTVAQLELVTSAVTRGTLLGSQYTPGGGEVRCGIGVIVLVAMLLEQTARLQFRRSRAGGDGGVWHR